MSSPIVSVALDNRRPGRGAVSLLDGQVLYLDLKTWALLHKFPRVSNGPSRVMFAKDKLVAVPLPSIHSAGATAGNASGQARERHRVDEIGEKPIE
ncbi:hypothetical protein, conserved [Eimeria praecox]|uniref:Uncharacterized protein n=1 Tax=Eimeria praecox TaxID=51316 RepID=U6H2E7_9EIME|nr:hypothetical protein, conserved [Eimeria praecox]